ncbi:MAG: hypothetical protein EOO00_13405 [Chitinophagaceae bacterium]|nr:MAG: hypothetical protein EOO00_13405 [Chitinophagaceae bacterium]
MKQDLHITAEFDQPLFLESLVEKLAYRRYDIGYVNALVPDTNAAIDTSSTETFTSGTVAIEDNGEMINMPFITRFLFTCTRKENEAYRLSWSVSLS